MTTSFFKSCKAFIAECKAEKLPRYDVEVRLYFGNIARLNRSLGSNVASDANRKAIEHVNHAKELLNEAEKMCQSSFSNADGLRKAVEQTLQQLGKEWYEEVSKDELAAIKAAMLSGPRGMATHSGHWYNCENGHPFAIGECGMPMEQATCPECGAPVGGQHHRAVGGVTRAMEMEDWG